MSNNNTPINQDSDNNVDLSFTGEKVPSGPLFATQASSLPGPSSSGASEPILLDNTPEETPPVATQPRSTIRPRRNMGPPQFYGERRYVVFVWGPETQHGHQSSSFTSPVFLYLYPSDFLTPLAKTPIFVEDSHRKIPQHSLRAGLRERNIFEDRSGLTTIFRWIWCLVKLKTHWTHIKLYFQFHYFTIFFKFCHTVFMSLALLCTVCSLNVFYLHVYLVYIR